MAAIEKHGVVVVVPPGSTRSEAVAWRRAARTLAEQGKARAFYRRRRDAAGRAFIALCVAANDSPETGDVLPLGPPDWIERPPFALASLSSALVAEVVAHEARRCSPRTAARLVRALVGEHVGSELPVITP